MEKPSPEANPISLTTSQVIIRIVAIISSVEFLIMLALKTLPINMGTFSEATLDLILLASFSTPLLYILVIKPFVIARDNSLDHISYLAYTDPLTQLPNRRLLSMHLEKCLASAVRHKVRGAVLLIDLDGFKTINDIHGHDAGDKVLIETAKRLLANTRTEDVAGRLGGDEFVILIQHLNSDEAIARKTAQQIAEKLVNAIKKPISFEGTSLNIGASIGIRILEFKNQDSKSILKEADSAMYHAKRTGAGRAVFFEENL